MLGPQANDSCAAAVFPILMTDHLTLRQPRQVDAADVLVFRGDYEVQKYNDEVLESVAQVEALIENMRLAFTKGEAVGWAVTVKPHDTVVGLFSLHNWDKRHRRAEFGFDLHRSYWGRGLAAEASRAIISYAFGTMRLNRIEAYTIADNDRSISLLERLGFRPEGLRRDYVWEDDQRYHDSAVYGLLRQEYTL